MPKMASVFTNEKISVQMKKIQFQAVRISIGGINHRIKHPAAT